MKFILYGLTSFFLIGCTVAQSHKEITVSVYFSKDSSIVQDAEIEVLLTTGETESYSTNENGQIELKLKCDVGYYIICDYPSHHKEKVKIMKPCSEDIKSKLNIYMNHLEVFR